MTRVDPPASRPTEPARQNPASAASSTCGAILLAAGFSRRFGAVKLRAQLPDGSTLLQKCFSNILQVTDNIIVVGRQDLLDSGTYDFLPQQSGLELVLCEDAASGMGHSLACAIRQVPEHWQSALICLADMPLIQQHTLKTIIAASSAHNIVIPLWQSQRGHPVCFGREHFAALARSQGDSGGRQVVEQNRQHIIELPITDQGVVQDIDTPEALALLMKP